MTENTVVETFRRVASAHADFCIDFVERGLLRHTGDKNADLSYLESTRMSAMHVIDGAFQVAEALLLHDAPACWALYEAKQNIEGRLRELKSRTVR